MLASIAEREQSFPTAGRLPVAFRSLSAAKLQNNPLIIRNSPEKVAMFNGKPPSAVI